MSRSYKGTLAAILFSLLAATAATAKDRSVTIDFGGGKENSFSIRLEGEWLNEVFEDLSEDGIDCEPADDREVREMLQYLRRKGEGSSYTLRDGDEVTKARRRHGKLELRKYERGEEPTLVVLPWAMGECMLGNPGPMRKLGGDFTMSIEKDGALVFEID